MAIIGREPPADIVVPAPQVSARHAEIRPLGNGLFQLTDLDSTNGTWVDGARISSRSVRLTDRVRLGSLAVDLTAFQAILEREAAAHPAAVASRPPDAVRARSAKPPSMPVPVASLARAEAPAKASRRSSPVEERGLPHDASMVLAMQKSFTTQAFMVWLAYHFIWIPGFIMNLVYLSEAKRIRQVTGVAPRGLGCLQTLLFVYVFLPLMLVLAVVFFGWSFLSWLWR